jgi:phage recombination protein Bet
MTVTALAERPSDTLTAPVVTSEQLDLVRKTVAKDATPAELQLYLYDCARHGVHPLDKLLHFTKRSGKYTPITSIDLMRIRAADTGDCLGISDPIFTGTPKKDDFASTVTVRRLVQNQVAEFTATARWTEYKPESNDFMWQRMPHTMLGKCAEALALRKGFPKQLAGLYAKEEMEQATSDPRQTRTTAPLPEKPDGYDEWLVDLIAVADTGSEALKATWESSKIAFRRFLTATEPEAWEALKERAAGKGATS